MLNTTNFTNQKSFLTQLSTTNRDALDLYTINFTTTNKTLSYDEKNDFDSLWDMFNISFGPETTGYYTGSARATLNSLSEILRYFLEKGIIRSYYISNLKFTVERG